MYRLLLRYGWPLVLLLFAVAAGIAASYLPRLEVDAGTNVLLNEDDPDLAVYTLTRPDWGYDEYAIVCCRRENWFTPESIEILKGLAGELEKAPHVESLTSILSVPLLRNRPSPFPGLVLPVFLNQEGADLKGARDELLKHTQAVGNLISEDGRDISILCYLDVPESLLVLEPEWSRAQGRRTQAKLAGDKAAFQEAEATLDRIREAYHEGLRDLRARRTAMVGAIRDIARAWSPRMNEPIQLSGIPVININLIEHIAADLRIFGITAFAFFTLAFLVVYRNFRWTAMPILAALIPVVLVVGTMVITGKTVTVITSNLPVLLFVLMLPYTVYFIERYRERRTLLPDESGLEATAGAAGAAWTPCFFSCITTMAGFASLMTSGINPVRTFGTMMTIGMAVGLVCVFLFLPSLSRPLRPTPPTPARGTSGPVRIFEFAVLQVPELVLLLGATMLGLSIWGITRIRVETKFIDYFRSGSEVYRGLAAIDTRMGGTTPLEVMLTSEQPGFFKTEEGLAALEAAAAYFDGVPEAGRPRSLKTLLDEARKAIPKLTVVRLAKIKAARDQIREFVNEDFTVSRVLVRFRETAPTLHRNNILRGLERHLKEKVEPLGVKARDVGIFRLYANMLNSLVKSQRDTFLLVLGAIFAMLLLLFRSLILAVIVIVPQVLPALVCLGTMGFTGIPLDVVTVMVASIAMGVGIDAAIQYTVRYRAELEACGGDRRAAVTRAHATVGRAIWIATTIVVAGFSTLALSRFVPTATFGLFTALAMLMGQFAALTLLPSLMLLFKVPRLRP